MPDFDKTYISAEAERGKFVPLTQAELTSLGMTTTGSRGRYALLTYPVDQTYSVVVSSGTFTQTVPNSIDNKSTVLAASGTVYPITFSNTTYLIEFWNESSNDVYLYWTVTTYATLTSTGMKIEPGTYYSIEHATDNVWLASPGETSDIRIINHYKA